MFASPWDYRISWRLCFFTVNLYDRSPGFKATLLMILIRLFLGGKKDDPLNWRTHTAFSPSLSPSLHIYLLFIILSLQPLSLPPYRATYLPLAGDRWRRWWRSTASSSSWDRFLRPLAVACDACCDACWDRSLVRAKQHFSRRERRQSSCYQVTPPAVASGRGP